MSERRYGTDVDATLRDRISRAFGAMPALESAEIGVQVLGSHVTLIGTVSTLAQEQLALDTVVECQGVRLVVSLLCLVTPAPPAGHGTAA
jgi:osmotically-inducible protein OsmY